MDFDAIKLDLSNIIDNLDKIQSNVYSGEFGQRGELYVVAQALLVLFILGGGVPFIGDALDLLVGPLLMLVGTGVIIAGVNDLGGSLSPWPVPVEDEEVNLVTAGMFAKVRHPIYSGLICVMAGLSIVTGSVSRLLLTAVLVYALDVKSDYEETKLMETFPDYPKYKEDVPGKLFPAELKLMLPWSDSDLGRP